MFKSSMSRACVLGGGLAVLGLTSVASAVPPDMTAIEFPVSTSSIVTVVVAAGAVLLLAYFGPKVGFSFVKKLLGRLKSAI